MKKGSFTLIELLIAICILLLVISITVPTIISLNRDYKVLITYLASYLKGREMIDIISKDCRIAVRVMDSYAGHSSAEDCLVLKVPSIDASRNIIDINEKFDYIIYRIQDGDLWKTVIPGADSARQAYDDVLKRSVEGLYVTRDGVSLSDIPHKSSVTRLTIWVSVSETVLGKDYRITPGTTVKLMNYEWEFVR